MERQLSDANEHLKEFVGTAAHDLRAPLQSAGTIAELIAMKFQKEVGPEGNQLIGYVTSGISRMMRLIEDLLVYAQAGEGELDENAPVAMSEALEAATENLRTEMEKNGTVVNADGLPVVEAAHIHVVQLLQNLIGNAIKYRGTANPQIAVSCEIKASHYVVRVRDNGTGSTANTSRKSLSHSRDSTVPIFPAAESDWPLVRRSWNATAEGFG